MPSMLADGGTSSVAPLIDGGLPLEARTRRNSRRGAMAARGNAAYADRIRPSGLRVKSVGKRRVRYPQLDKPKWLS